MRMAENRADGGGQEPGHAAAADPERWVEKHGDYLFRYALLRLGNRDQAEEAVQDALLAALDAQERFAGRSSERTWLTAILKHKVVDRIGRLSRERQVILPADDDAASSDHFDAYGHWKREPARWPGDPERLLERKELRQILERCIAGLPERHREAFVLRQLDGLSSGDICKVMGISATNLWVILHRARLRLRGCMEDNWFGRPDAEEGP
jgi:RNA polymerase sigma-70 factor (TIGR02943 family)